MGGEGYIRENEFVYKFGGETSAYRDYFFKDSRGGRSCGNQSISKADSLVGISAIVCVTFKSDHLSNGIHLPAIVR